MSEPGEANLKHLDEMTCLLYLERQLDRARGLEVSSHTQECESCRTLLYVPFDTNGCVYAWSDTLGVKV